MSPYQIGKIEKVNLREIWKREDTDFTKWLADRIYYLNEVIDIKLYADVIYYHLNGYVINCKLDNDVIHWHFYDRVIHWKYYDEVIYLQFNNDAI